jgi:NAD(P)-dependent dehydrogenase (short-subunit alcohol dehydrogenase family)
VHAGSAGPRQAVCKPGARKVAILDLDADGAKSAAEELGAGHLGLGCDVSDPASCKKAAEQAIAALGKIDILINNAGITQPLKLMDISPENWQRVVDVNMTGVLYLSQAFIPHMRTRKQGSIACMSSVSAQRGGGIFGGPHYSAAKAGVLGLAKAMARELGPDGIRVNSVTPGLIQTDITGGKLTPEMKADIISGIPLQRLGDAVDVANIYLFPGLRSLRLRHRRSHRRQWRHAHPLRRGYGRSSWTRMDSSPMPPISRSAPTGWRRNALRMGEVQGQGYIAQALDIADVLAVAYFHAMRYRPEDPDPGRARPLPALERPLRDRALRGADRGRDRPRSRTGDLRLRRQPPADVRHGELHAGHGDVGRLARARARHRRRQSPGLKRKGSDARVYTLFSDGELDEGSVWEAIMSASHFKLDN